MDGFEIADLSEVEQRHFPPIWLTYSDPPGVLTDCAIWAAGNLSSCRVVDRRPWSVGRGLSAVNRRLVSRLTSHSRITLLY